MAICGSLCRWCIGFNFTLGLTALFMWLSLRASSPNFSIVSLSVPAFNKSIQPNLTSKIPPENTTIFFDLKLENTNKDKGIYYDALNLTFYYGPNQSDFVGNFTVPPFYQGHKKTARRWEMLNGGGAFWGEALRAVSETNKTSFKVRLVTKVRYKIIAWETRHHGFNLAADVEVSELGLKLGKKGAKFHSGARRCYCGSPWVAVLVLGAAAFV